MGEDKARDHERVVPQGVKFGVGKGKNYCEDGCGDVAE